MYINRIITQIKKRMHGPYVRICIQAFASREASQRRFDLHQELDKYRVCIFFGFSFFYTTRLSRRPPCVCPFLCTLQIDMIHSTISMLEN